MNCQHFVGVASQVIRHRLVVLARRARFDAYVSGLAIAAIATTFNAINLGAEQMGGAGGIAITMLITFASGALIYTKQVADFLGVNYTEIQGTSDFFNQLIKGDWQQDCLVIPLARFLNTRLFFRVQ